MSKFFNLPVVGIDVSADFSMVAVLEPNGDLYRKVFKILHDAEGFHYFLNEMRKVEEEFSMKPVFFMESTGVYHLTLFHFLKGNNFETFIINPLITNNNKNYGIRKVKNDKLDALSIATLAKYQNIKISDFLDVNIFSIKSLCRDYYNLVDNRANFKKKLSSDLRMFFPGYHTIFSNITGNTSLAILSKYSSPSAIIEAPRDEVINIIKNNSHKSLEWSLNTYNKLLKVAESANKIAICNNILRVSIDITITMINTLDNQINILLKEIEAIVNSNSTSQYFRDSITLLLSLPGVGFITAVTLVSELGDPRRFKHPKEMVAYFGIDPSVNESGKFKSDKNKMSKRGSSFGRRALYTVAISSIRKSSSGKPINSTLYEYRNENLKGKKNKVAIGAIMHKIVKYIFAILRDQTPYEIRDPKLHNKMYLNNNSRKVS